GQAYQTEILRALQAWASVANVNLVVVQDSGAPLGTPGAVQGDPRFGDIRVAAIPLPASTVSTSIPYSPLAGTWAGDMLLNRNAPLGAGGYDLYTIALHEAGHIFGLDGNLTNPSSPMFEYYTGAKAGLGSAEVSAMPALYGARTPDRFEGWWGNDTLATAT